jgi:transposase
VPSQIGNRDAPLPFRHGLLVDPVTLGHSPILKPVAQRLKARGKPHKLVIVAIARRLVIIANAILKTGTTWRTNPIA